MASTRYASNVSVPFAVVERAFVRDMVYPACPRCATSLASALQKLPVDRIGVTCTSCGMNIPPESIAYKYRLKLQVLIDTAVCDAMLFNEAAEALIGAPATRLRKLVVQYPTLPSLLEELLLGLPVQFTYQPAENRAAASENSYQRDLRVLSLHALDPVLLPKPPISLALAQLTHDHIKHRNTTE